jgi:hypothetical protein
VHIIQTEKIKETRPFGVAKSRLERNNEIDVR